VTPAPDAPTRDIANRADIEHLVRAFYRDAATDDRLGPIFDTAQVDWPAHIDTLTAFWAWQLLGERGYHGNPLRAHAPIHERNPFTEADFARWLDLFTATVDHQFAGPTADAAKQRAAKMASALHRLLDQRDEPGDQPVTPHLARAAGRSQPPPSP
jgi:hemoglobin